MLEPISIVEVMRQRVTAMANAPAYHMLDESLNIRESLTWSQLHERALCWKIAFERRAPTARHVLLVFSPGLAFIEAFLGCLYAGRVAVPAYPPTRRGAPRFLHMARLCKDACLAADAHSLPGLRRSLGDAMAEWQIVDSPAAASETEGVLPVLPAPDDIAFIQFTSGSTSSPKGVLVSHANILANQVAIQSCFGHKSDSRVLGWLPSQHDMGLVGIVLQPMYVGIPCWLMAPAHFARDPMAWLEAISRYRVSTSGGPDFGYAQCVRKFDPVRASALDLSSWKVAFNGAEPVRAATLQHFENAFAAQGFNRAAWMPCYGLAEATLLVAGKNYRSVPTVFHFDRDALECDGVLRASLSGTALVGCGRSEAGTNVAIVDPETAQQCDAGRQGEIWVAGPGVARGYHAIDAAATFEARTDDGRGPWLRTGDLGCLLDGDLFVTGRMSDLIIVRGRNHHPHDIELTAQGAHPGVAAGGVAAFQCDEADTDGLGLVVELSSDARHAQSDVVARVTAAIAAHHGVAVCRVGLVRLGQLPRTTSGKVQRGAARLLLDDPAVVVVHLGLRATQREGNVRASDWAASAPQFAALVAEMARRPPAELQAEDTLADLGLDSLAVCQLHDAIRRATGVSLDLESLFEGATLADLADTIRKDCTAPAPDIAAEQASASLSEYQQRFLVLDELDAGSAAHTVAVRLHLAGNLDESLLQRSLAAVVRRHDGLQLRLDADGRPDLVAMAQPVTVMPERFGGDTDAELDQAQRAFFARGFDLHAGPLWRFALRPRGAGCHELLLSFHHIVCDGWSIRVFVRELLAFYEAGASFTAPHVETALPYSRFVAWQQAQEHDAALAALCERFKGIDDVLDLPADPDIASAPGGESGALHVPLNGERTATVLRAAIGHGVSPAAVWLAAFSLLLARLANRRDIVVGTPASTRELRGSAQAVGLYLNLTPVRITIDPAADFTRHLETTSSALAQARRDRAVPFERVLEAVGATRVPGRTPLFQVLFNYLSDAGVAGNCAGLDYRLEPVLDIGAKFDITLYVIDDVAAPRLLLSFDAQRFGLPRMRIFAQQLLHLVDRLCCAPHESAWGSQLRPVLPAANEAVAANPWIESLDERVARWGHDSKIRHRPALEWPGGCLDYAGLYARAHSLAVRLRAAGQRPGEVVAIVTQRVASLPLAILAVMRAGGVFSVIDASYPVERIETMLDVAAPTIVLTCCAGADVSFAWTRSPVIALGALPNDSLLASGDAEPLDYVPRSAAQAACLTFTSGSSGRPEGVLGSHGGLTAFLPWQQQAFSLSVDDRFSMLSGLSHDPLQRDLFTAWWIGADVIVPPRDVRDEAIALARWMAESRVSVCNLTPSLARVLIAGQGHNASLSCLRLAFLVGETLTAGVAQALQAVAPNAELVNLYGSTETQRALAHLRILAHSQVPDPIPLGDAPPGMALEVVRPDGSAVDIGEMGEICIRSPHLALGYVDQNSPRNPQFETNSGAGRRYRSGDRGWRTASGEILFAGRVDRQIGISGYRVELGDIEAAAVAALPLLAARAKWRTDTASLVLYYVPAPGALLDDPSQVLKALAGRLPRYMLPQAVMQLDNLPLTPNGKCDDARLPPIAIARVGTSPTTATEIALAREWLELLGGTMPFREDGFFALGGSSLKLLQLQARIGRRFGARLSLQRLLNAQTLGAIASLVDASDAEAEQVTIVADSASSYEAFPLNDIQRAYLVGRQMSERQGTVGSQSYYEFETLGLNLAAFERAWNRVVAHHPMLRAVVVESSRQQVLALVPHYAIAVHEGDEATLCAVREDMAFRQFDPAEWPLFRLEASRWPSGELRLHFSFDFMVADAWSWNVLLQDVRRCYEDPGYTLAPTSIEFRDYVLAEQSWRQSASHARALAFWRERIQTLPAAPQLPFVAATEQPAQPRFARHSQRIGAADWQRFKSEAAQRGATPTAALLAVFGATLAMWSKSPQFTVNLTLFDRRPVHHDVERIVGDFTSVLLVSMDFSRPSSAAEALRRTQSELWQCLEHREVSGAQVMREINTRQLVDEASTILTMPIVFTSKLGLNSERRADLAPSWLGRQCFGLSMTPQVWLDSQVSEDDEGALNLHWDAVEAMFEPCILNTMQAAMARLVVMLAQNPGTWDTVLTPLLPAVDIELQARANDTEAAVPTGLLHEPLLAHAERTPHATALVGPQGETLDYDTLCRHAAAGARTLAGLVAPGEPVAVWMPKCREQAVGVLACHLSGTSYLPLDPLQGPTRLERIVQRTRCRAAFVLPGADTTALRALGVRCIEVALDKPVATFVSLDVPVVSPKSIAYVIFTSGSTGEPKGVVTSHRGALNTCVDVNRRFGVGPNDAVLTLSALNFDLSVYDIFGVLGAGGRVVVPHQDYLRDPAHWLGLVQAHGVTIWNSVPALMQMLVSHCEDFGQRLPASLRLVMLSGDWIPVTLSERIRRLARKDVVIVSLGGATEASIWSILHVIEPREYRVSISYGRAMANQRFYVLDALLRPRPTNVVGELYIGGIGLADGYWEDPERTAHAFLTDPSTGERLYRTGDLGRWRPDGEIEFLGREDTQVKVQGYRVELGEIEAALDALDEVASSVVVATGERGQARRLVAYVVATPGAVIGRAQLRTELAARLPGYMVPATFVMLDDLPLSANGKIDRKRLPAVKAQSTLVSSALLNTYQRRLCGLFGEILSLPEVDPQASFFDMGGTSLEAVRLQGAIHNMFALDVSMAALFRHASAIGLGTYLAQIETDAVSSAPLSEAAQVTDSPPPANLRQQSRRRREDIRRRMLVDGDDAARNLEIT